MNEIEIINDSGIHPEWKEGSQVRILSQSLNGALFS